jgi:hypothetical protein
MRFIAKIARLSNPPSALLKEAEPIGRANLNGAFCIRLPVWRRRSLSNSGEKYSTSQYPTWSSSLRLQARNDASFLVVGLQFRKVS